MRYFLFNSVYYFCICCIAFLIPFGLTACSNDEFADYKKDGGLKSFTSFTATLDDVAGTRAYLDAEATDGIRRVHWHNGDVIYVYSDTDTELKEFVMTSLSEDNKATFTGEKVTGNKFYAVFAPFTKFGVDEKNPEVVRLEDVFPTVSEREFTIPMVAVSIDGSFAFKQTMGIVHVTTGNVHQLGVVSFRGNSDEIIGGSGYIDFSDEKPSFKLDADARTGGMGQVFGLAEFIGKYTDIYYAIPPMVFENGFKIEIRGIDADGNEFEIDKSYNSHFEVKAGTVSRFSLVDISAELEAQGYYEIIEFADENVKAICIENWDTNGDGELSRAEAAAVTDIGQVFRDNTDIASFNEFQYFTGVPSIGEDAFEGCGSLTSIEIPAGVTSIGNYAFYACYNLTSIEIPEGVTSIGNYTFSGCSGLTSIEVDKNNRYYDSRNDCNAIIETNSNTLIAGCASTVIPANVTSIGEGAFFGCSSLTSIVIPEGVTSIGEYAFEGCSSLTSIVIPEGVTSIGSYAFSNCRSLASIVVDKNNRYYDSRNDCNAIIETNSNTLIAGCASTVIPANVTSIGYGAFLGCSSLTSIVIPEGVTSIGGSAFGYCISLTSIEIPEGVTSIGNAAFERCYSLTSIEIPESVTSIGRYAFAYCRSLTSFKCLATNPPVYDNIFAENRGYSYSGTIYVPAGSVEAYKAADGWSNYASQIRAIIIAQEGNIGFADNNVKAICVQNWDTNGDGELSYAEAAAVTDIGQVFYNTDIVSFNELQYFTGVTLIGDNAFANCSSLTSIVIPGGVTSIGGWAFYGCSSLTSIVIPDGVTSIGHQAFDDCSGLASIVISEGVTSIGSFAFSGCSSLTSIKVDKNNLYYDSRNDCNAIIETNNNTLIAGCASTVIPAGVTSIGDYAFDGCRSLTSMVIPEGVTSIGYGAFFGCSSLTSIEIPESVTSIGHSVFSNCSSLTSIKVDKNNLYYDSRDDCNAIIETNSNTLVSGCASTVIPASVTSIDSYAFSGCNLTSIVIPASVTSIGGWAFDGWRSLTSIEIPGSVTSIGTAAFQNCSSLTSIEIPASVTSIGSSAFFGCSSLTSFTCLAINPPALGSNAFYDVSGTIYVPAGSVEAYKAADGWSNYASQIQAIQE